MLRIIRIPTISRYYSIKHAAKEPIKYTTTINLPKTKFPARLSAAKRQELENKLISTTFAQTYQYQNDNLKEPSYILHDGPPYANGDLHMGHAVNKILKDITIRHHVVKGQKIHYVPGWDCHGLPIELKALASTDTSEKTPNNIRSKSRQFALDAIDRQRAEFRSWGILSDWHNNERLYFTFNPDFICNQLRLFLDFYKKGLVYRDLKPVYWSPSSRTALAEAELEYDANFVSPSVYVRFALKSLPPSIELEAQQKLFALIWTTTPWTLPSNQAICFNPNLEYSIVELKDDSKNLLTKELYLIASSLIDDFVRNTKIECTVKQTVAGTDLIHCTYQHPIYGKENALPFLDASHVQDTKGTGLVHTAPAHGPDDFLICLSKNIPVKSLVNEEGIYNSDAPSYLKGKSVLKEGNDLVLQNLKDDVLYADTFTHSYPLDWRTKEPVILRASEQWFINTSELKEQAVKEIEKIEIYPRVNAEASKNALRTQVMKRPYWCISRQRSWGVPIPVFYDNNTRKVLCNEQILKHICNMVTKEGNIDFWWSKSIEELLPATLLKDLNVNISDVEKGMDIFDIWFDSGSTWSHVLKDQQIADLYLEGYDQFTGWFQSSLLTSVGARNSAPYKALFVHGFTVDEKGHKMSKSLGNVISPTDIRKTYGVDVLRWWVASHGTQHMAITVSDKLLQQSAENLSKIRSTLRYLNGVIGERSNITNCLAIDKQIYLNRYLLNKLFDFEQEIFSLYDCYEYNRVVANVQNFVTNQISAIYVHLIKDRLYCGPPAEIEGIRTTLEKCYTVLSKALWPIAPFLVEESWSYYDASSPFHQHKIVSDSSWKNALVEEVVDTALNVKRLINQKATEKNSWLLNVSIKCNEKDIELLKHLQPRLEQPSTDSELCEILQVGSVTLHHCGDISSDFVIEIDKIEASLCPRCRRHAVLHENAICHRCNKVLELQK
ncbi:isoleucine--tRNA ligase, mitochondrial [Calliphora vicina]|uniref:isoleucine--tRNA ligase, mitochondrial n=1 Tax=Calliphora vicina TaxID=7373 RepID=UPI00325B9FE6